jgi:hypothetical protein
MPWELQIGGTGCKDVSTRLFPLRLVPEDPKFRPPADECSDSELAALGAAKPGFGLQ